MADSKDQKRLRNVVHAELKAVMDKHEVGGMVITVSPQSAAWLLVFPSWSAVARDPMHGMRFKTSSKNPHPTDPKGELGLHLLLSVRDISLDVANLFSRFTRQIIDEIRKQGGTVEHKAWTDGVGGISGDGRPDPMGGKIE